MTSFKAPSANLHLGVFNKEAWDNGIENDDEQETPKAKKSTKLRNEEQQICGATNRSQSDHPNDSQDYYIDNWDETPKMGGINCDVSPCSTNYTSQAYPNNCSSLDNYCSPSPNASQKRRNSCSKSYSFDSLGSNAIAIPTPRPISDMYAYTYTHPIFQQTLASKTSGRRQSAIALSPQTPYVYQYPSEQSPHIQPSPARQVDTNWLAKKLSKIDNQNSTRNQSENENENEKESHQAHQIKKKRSLINDFGLNHALESKADILREMDKMKKRPRFDITLLGYYKCSLQDLLGFPELLQRLCIDKWGSHYVQQICEDKYTGMQQLERLVKEIISPHGLYLCRNIFGNYVIQKLLEITCERTRNERKTDRLLWQQVCMPDRDSTLCVASAAPAIVAVVDSHSNAIRRIGFYLLKHVFVGHVRELKINSKRSKEMFGLDCSINSKF
ncbi:hypothetical protein RFI_21875, partial [Reticulomyxa filosa]